MSFFIVHVRLFHKKSSAVTNNVCHQHCSLDISGNQGHFLLIRILIFVTYLFEYGYSLVDFKVHGGIFNILKSFIVKNRQSSSVWQGAKRPFKCHFKITCGCDLGIIKVNQGKDKQLLSSHCCECNLIYSPGYIV